MNPELIKNSFKAAFPHTIPILTGFAFLGFTYGLYMHTLGFSFVYPMLMSLLIYAGSVEFVVANMLIGAFNPLQTFVMALVINARHLFYGISMLDKFKGTGLKKLYLIFGMCDETFSVNYAAVLPPNCDKGWFMFFVTLLNQFYWSASATIGGLAGSLIKFETKGLDFALTALFTVIFIEQWLKEKNHAASLLGLGISLLCLVAFGADGFIIPSMAGLLVILTAARTPIEERIGEDA